MNVPYNTASKTLTVNTTDDGRRERTEAMLAKFRGLTDEWVMLKGVLCMSHGLSCYDALELDKVLDTDLIAQRMDEMVRLARTC